MKELTPITNLFENAKHIDEETAEEYWLAREMCDLLGYSSWQMFERVLVRAIQSCLNIGVDVKQHFNKSIKLVKVGSGAERNTKDYRLSRFGCYLTAMNGDPSKEEVARAQAYFAMRTREAELVQQELITVNNANAQQILEKLEEIRALIEYTADKSKRDGFNKAVAKLIGGVPLKNLVYTDD